MPYDCRCEEFTRVGPNSRRHRHITDKYLQVKDDEFKNRQSSESEFEQLLWEQLAEFKLCSVAEATTACKAMSGINLGRLLHKLLTK